MSMMAESNSNGMEITSITQLSDFFQRFESIDVSKLIESITYNVESQTVIIQLANLLRTEAERISRHRSEPREDNELKRLSEHYRTRYPELVEHFRNWKPCREELVQTSNTYADTIDRNYTVVSSFRILTSVADIFGTIMQFQQSNSSWSKFALENASAFGLMSLFIEMTLSKQMHIKARKIIKKDQELFQHMKNYFKQTEELDRAVKSFFPYGIDEDLVRQIDKSSATSDEYSKLFMSIVASNVKKNVSLFRDLDFLDKADKFSTSEVGLQWFHKVTLQDNPVLYECLKSDLGDEINKILSTSIEKPEIFIDASILMSSRIRFKILLNAITIFSALSNLWNDCNSEDSGALRSLADKSKKELDAMKTIIRLLKPSGVEVDDVLQ